MFPGHDPAHARFRGLTVWTIGIAAAGLGGALELAPGEAGGDGRSGAQLSARTFCTFLREFSSFKRQGAGWETMLIPYTVLPVYEGDRAIRFSRALSSRRGELVPVVGKGGRWSGGRVD